jgi:hypothetical protein
MTEKNNIPDQGKAPDLDNIPTIKGDYHKYYLTFKDSTGRRYFVLKQWGAKVYPKGEIVELSDYQKAKEEFIEKLNNGQDVKAWSGKRSEPYFVDPKDIDTKSIVFKEYDPNTPARNFPEFD